MAETRNQKQEARGQKSREPAPTSQARHPRPAPRAVEPYRRSGDVARSRYGSPFAFVGRLMGDMERLFEDLAFGRALSTERGESAAARAAFAPQVDVFERDGSLVLHADLPGLRREDVHVDVEEGILSISGERRHMHEHERGGVHRCERSYGSFMRRLALPEGVDPASIQATFDDGVLEVTMPMPRQDAAKGKSIPIRSASGGPDARH